MYFLGLYGLASVLSILQIKDLLYRPPLGSVLFSELPAAAVFDAFIGLRQQFVSTSLALVEICV
jgi:hypothetical protein